jgi:hypothetical protein
MVSPSALHRVTEPDPGERPIKMEMLSRTVKLLV